ncbi:hypothetical protein RJ639_036118 [Escallonia herrerae]|uniref:Uncharacterized protein n=1 Tax=Escallonia herrerae TaxID=1293975 RepID=A0AA88WSU1_9ASTE|nr:hypothetical protein RJ639_036118 [Escallonia herrerae]
MELIKLSKFKLQLRVLISEFVNSGTGNAPPPINCTSSSRFSFEILYLLIIIGLQRPSKFVNYLQKDNVLIENKQKESKETINSLLHSRERFVKAYEDSTCEMKRSIESRDRQIAVLNEKINAHLLLVDSIAKEAFSVKQIVDNAQHVLRGKEEVGMY